MDNAQGERGREARQRASAMVALLLSASIAFPTSALALEAEFVNDTTGANSSNTNGLDSTTTINFSVTNNGTVDNNIDLTLNTGGNTITNNTTVGDVTTGDVTFDIESLTEVNDTDVDTGDLLGVDGQRISSVNRNTGSGSTNDNQTNVTNDVNLTINNDLDVTNDVTLDVNTGNNDISNNTTVGDITTGDIDGSISLTTVGNQVNVGGGDIDPGNGGNNPGHTDSGSDSNNQISSIIPTSSPTTTSELVGIGGGEFFPAGSQDTVLTLFLLFLTSLALVRFQDSLRTILRRPSLREARVA